MNVKVEHRVLPVVPKSTGGLGEFRFKEEGVNSFWSNRLLFTYIGTYGGRPVMEPPSSTTRLEDCTRPDEKNCEDGSQSSESWQT